MITDTDEAFEIFWNAGMRKINKKKARSIFAKIAKDQQPPNQFAMMLAGDIELRLVCSQFGFDKMHPTTYLNGERWEDELPPQNQVSVSASTGQPQSTRERSIEQDILDRSWAL